MAEIIVSQKNKGRKTATPHIDFTPMVDLGFLLITFFIYTTTLTESKSIIMNMPIPAIESPTQVPEESTITLVLSKDHTIHYYHGNLSTETHLGTTTFTTSGIREVLADNTIVVHSLPPTYSKEAHKLHVIIKPSDACAYDDLVKIMDEMIINAVPYYVIVDITQEEKDLLASNMQPPL